MVNKNRTQKAKEDKTLLAAFGGDKKLLDEFNRFRDKEKQRKIRRDLELKTQDILENELREKNADAIEILNKVYRRAWTMACKALGADEAEFPSRY